MKQIIYGRNPVKEWLFAGLPIESIVISKKAGGKPVEEILHLAQKKGIPTSQVMHHNLTQLVGHENHQNIVAKVETPNYTDFDELLNKIKHLEEAPLIVILDGVQDPHNLGAIIRSADGAGVHGIIIPKDKAVGMTPVVFKSSAGAAAHVPLVQVTNVNRTLEELKENGFWVTGTSDKAEQDYTSVDYNGPTVIVMGSEGKGMRHLVQKNCDFLVNIPMHGKVNSLNVSVASALLFFEARRQRTK